MTAFAAPTVATVGATGPDAPLVVLLHGRGADETEILSLAALLPTGPTYTAVRAPIAEGGGYAWFANRGIGRPVAESLTDTMSWFRTWLGDVAPAGRPVVLIGFSGGAAFAGGLLLDDPARYAGAAILYGTLPFDAGVPTTPDRLTGVPVLVAHGADPVTRRPIDPVVRLREFIELAKLADQAGLDVFGVGEHHRPDFAIASPPVVLAAIAQATEQIRLTSTVTVLSTADPVKVFEDFTAVDLLSGGRAEITAGRGAYTESFPLFGYDLADYDELFEEKLGLLLQLNAHQRVTWSGRHRPALRDVGVYPRPVQPKLPVWIAVGGTPASVVRAGRHGLPLYLAILGQPERFAALADLYRQTGTGAGHSPDQLRVGVTSHFYVGTTSQGARDTFYPYYSRYMGDNMPSARGQRLPRDAFDAWGSRHGALFVGSPQEIIDKILWEHEILGHDRFLAQVGLGGLPFAETARSIELLATEILPVVRRETAPATALPVS